MKILTSKEREAVKKSTVTEPYQYPKAIPSHVYRITNDPDWKKIKYYAVKGNEMGQVRLYSLNMGVVWCDNSTFGDSDYEWEDITDQVYLNTDDLEK